MRDRLLAVLWFGLVFCLGFLWFFPVDAVVRGQLTRLESQTGMRVEWTGEHWSLWHSTLTNVRVVDRTGHEWLSLGSLDVKPRPTGIYVQGTAPWGGISAVVRTSEIDLDVDGYPLPASPTVPFENGTLRFHPLIYDVARHDCRGVVGISGRVDVQLYSGPIDLSGNFSLNGTQGQIGLEVAGDRLHGRGDLTLEVPAGNLSAAKLNGPMRIEKQGLVINCSLSVDANHMDIKTQ